MLRHQRSDAPAPAPMANDRAAVNGAVGGDTTGGASSGERTQDNRRGAQEARAALNAKETKEK